MNHRVKIILASAFGLGLSPIAPGSFGACLGVLAHVLVALTLPASFLIPTLSFLFIAFIFGTFLLTPWAQGFWGSPDPKNFVLDEVVGYLLVPICIYSLTPSVFHPMQLWQLVLWGFVLFRILDVIKVPPARQIDRATHSASGILLDDIVSAIYAVLVLYCIQLAGLRFGLTTWVAVGI